jgi:hypothetical protein
MTIASSCIRMEGVYNTAYYRRIVLPFRWSSCSVWLCWLGCCDCEDMMGYHRWYSSRRAASFRFRVHLREATPGDGSWWAGWLAREWRLESSRLVAVAIERYSGRGPWDWAQRFTTRRRGPLRAQRLTLESPLRATVIEVRARVPQIKGFTIHPLHHYVVGPRVIVSR